MILITLKNIRLREGGGTLMQSGLAKAFDGKCRVVIGGKGEDLKHVQGEKQVSAIMMNPWNLTTIRGGGFVANDSYFREFIGDTNTQFLSIFIILGEMGLGPHHIITRRE